MGPLESSTEENILTIQTGFAWRGDKPLVAAAWQ
jgi:hypothetical protein